MKISAIFYFQKYCDMLQNREKEMGRLLTWIQKTLNV